MPTPAPPEVLDRFRAELARRAAASQRELCDALEALDGRARFSTDAWRRPAGGGGVARVLQDGAVIEKAGVNVSDVHGALVPTVVAAAGLSVVIHPVSPLVPTAHMNVRFLARSGAGAFGGGADLTPYYLFEEDCAHFHRTLREVCDRHLPGRWADLKRGADDYFLLRHRGEHRGVGGIFFEDAGADLDRALEFVSELPRAFLAAWLPIAERRKDLAYGEAERRWQEIRRGRYVEFNLVLDAGTAFGLATGGRTESVLMSLPPRVRWPYDHRPEPGSPEEELLEVLRRPRDWT